MSHRLPCTWFVSRHPGAIAWAQQQALAIDKWVSHLALCEVLPGDTVIGSLPVNLAAEVCSRGARYFHLSLPLSPALRGQELSASDMAGLSAKIEAFEIIRKG